MTDKIIASIDIGTSKIAVIVAKLTEGEIEPRVMGFSSGDSAGVKRGQIVDINQVAEKIEKAIDKAERMAGQKITHAFVNIGGPHIESINSQGVVAVSQPEVEIIEDDIDRVVDAAKAISIASSRQIIEVIPREYIVDGQGGIKNPLGMSGVRLEVNTHIITAGLTNIKNIDRCLSDLGVDISSFVFSGLASAQAVLTETEKELGACVLDFGGGKLDGCIYIEGALTHSFSLPIGARHITNDLAVGLRVSLESAEKIKLFLTHHVSHKKTDLKKDEIDISSLRLPEGLTAISYKNVIDEIIKPRLEEIFEKVLSTISVDDYVTKIPSGLIISGGGALTINLVESAKKIIGLPCRIGLPGKISGLVDEIIYPQYATVVGSLLYAKSFHGSDKYRGVHFKDFDKIFRSISVKNSWKKLNDLFKSMIP